VGENGVSKPLVERGGKIDAVPTQSYLQSAAQWDLEQDYESRPRKLKSKKDSSRLPIKTQDGRIEQVEQVEPQAQGSDSFLGTSSDESEAADAKGPTNGSTADERPVKVIVLAAKEEMARIARLINQDPEEYVDRLKDLAELVESPILPVKKLALVTQLAVFKDIIPGYRIRPLTQEAMREKVSKEIRKIRMFEQSVLSSYQDYVNTLATIAKARHPKGSELAELVQVAISCACTLVTAVPHFNWYEDLLKILLDKLSRQKVNEAHTKCITTLEQLFQEDEEGVASQEAVSMVTRMMKARNYHIDESVLNTFLHLRLLNEFAFKASASAVDGDWSKGKGKGPKQPREFRTKRQRKALKEFKAAEKEYQETDASVQREARDRAQAETLKLVFGAYFRILKTREPQLMGAVLEGLARYAHLINQEFFGDLLVTLQELAHEALSRLEVDEDDDAAEEADPDSTKDVSKSYITNTSALRSALLCTTTSFALLSSQEAASLNLDLSSFANILYTLLLHLFMAPDLELTTKTPRLPPPSSATGPAQPQPKVHATALSTLLLRALTSSLTPRHTPPVRLAAFTHRLMLASLHVPEKTGQAIMALIRELATHQGRKIRGLWSTEEQRGDGRFEALVGIEACKPFCGTVWEGELLRLHYADGVRKGLGELESIVKSLA
jgi:nucleolar complex protein 3